MGKNSALARGVRTFFAFLAAALASAAFVDAVNKQDVRLTGTLLAIAVVGALITGIIAYIWAILPSLRNAHSAFTKALATFLQSVAGGLTAVGLAELTKAAALDFVTQLWHVVFVAFFAALTSAAINGAEDANAPANEPGAVAVAPAPPAPPA